MASWTENFKLLGVPVTTESLAPRNGWQDFYVVHKLSGVSEVYKPGYARKLRNLSLIWFPVTCYKT